MANPFSKGWKYLTASLDHAIDENADPKIQLQQAANEAKRQHNTIVEHAAVLLGDRRQWEMKLHRLQEEQKKLEGQARAAISAGDNQVAEIYATQLVTVEQQLQDAKTMHAQAVDAATKAQQMVKESELRLQDQMAQFTQLQAQADQAAMQQANAQAMGTMENMAARPDASVPTLDAVREKIERRYANALGAQELAENSVSDRMQEIAAGRSDFQASARLDEIRAQLAAEKTAELEAGTQNDAADTFEKTGQAEPENPNGGVDRNTGDTVDAEIDHEPDHVASERTPTADWESGQIPKNERPTF